MEQLIFQKESRPCSMVDSNQLYDDIVNYFVNAGLDICNIAFFYQILLLYPLQDANVQSVITALSTNRTCKWTWCYSCACLAQLGNIKYCAIFVDWGDKPFTHSKISKFGVQINGETLTPVMIKVLKKHLPVIKEFFKTCVGRCYILNEGTPTTRLDEPTDTKLEMPSLK